LQALSEKKYWQAREKFFVGLPEKSTHYQVLGSCSIANLVFTPNSFTFYVHLYFF